MTKFWAAIIKVIISVLGNEDKDKVSADAEYNRLTSHLDYLDEKIFKLLSLSIQVVIAVIGGAFFLSTIVLEDPSLWASAASWLMGSIAIASIFFIGHHLYAWGKYRKALAKKFPFTGSAGCFWWLSEVVQCVLIVAVWAGFLHYNPLKPENYKQIHGNKNITTSAPPSVSPPPLRTAPSTETTAAEKVPTNYIRNGLFNYPPTSPESAWGSGQYSDRFLSDSLHREKYWINFSGAKIDASIIQTPKGSALRITNRSGKRPDVVGVMEQRINTSPGMYELSFLAKGEADLEDKALQVCTTDDWAIVSDGKARGLEVTKNGPFDWERFKERIEITQSSPITLSVVSKGAGTIYLTDFSLIRVSGSDKG